MLKRVSRISIFQSAKILAIILLFVTAIVGWPMAIYFVFAGDIKSAFVALLVPFFYGFFGFIIHAIGFWIYNVIAIPFGGIEINLEDRPE